MQIIIQFLLILVLLTQLMVILFSGFVTYKNYKNDKAFHERLKKDMEESAKRLRELNE